MQRKSFHTGLDRTFFVLTVFLYETKAKQVYKPKLVNSKSGDHHDFPLGVLEATGRLRDGEREILIMDVGRGGVGERSGLQVGDRIKKIENITPDKFSKKTDAGLSGPQDLLGRSLDKKSQVIQIAAGVRDHAG